MRRKEREVTALEEKLELLNRQKVMRLAMADGAHSLLEGETPCEYSFAYESLIGEGVVEFLETDAEKVHGLEAIMRHQADYKAAPVYPPAALRAVAVGRIAVSGWTGKRHLPR